MTAKCRVCGKEFTVLYPQLYVYKRGTGNGVRFFCSYSCTRIFDRKDCEKMKVTLENKKKAVQIAIDGGNPLKYLEECGAKSPSGTWYHIKKDLKAKDPDRYMELPEKYRPAAEVTAAEAMQGMKDAADDFFGACDGMGLKVDEPKPIDGGEWEKMETPESNKLKVAVIGKPETAGKLKLETRYTVTAIKYPEIGEFYYDRKYNSIDWRTPEGDEVSMSPTAWKILQHDLKEIMTVLGVEAE